MQINQKIADLATECAIRGITLPQGAKLRKKDYAEAIRKDVLKKEIKPESLMWYVNDIETPMLCSNFKDFQPLEQQKILSSNQYVAQPNFDGVRMLFCKDDTGIHLYGRTVGQDCFPVEYKEISSVYKEEIPTFGLSKFIFDCELVCSKKRLRAYLEQLGVTAESDKVAILTLFFLNQNKGEKEAKEAIEKVLSLAGDVLELVVLDVLMADGVRLEERPLDERMEFLRTLQPKTTDFFLCNSVVPETRKGDEFAKINYLKKCLSQGYDGIMLKDLTARYETQEKRTEKMVKIKKTILTEGLLPKYFKPIEAFILGAKKGKVAMATSDNGVVGVVAYIDLPEAMQDGTVKEQYCMKRYLIDGDYMADNGMLVNPVIVEEL